MYVNGNGAAVLSLRVFLHPLPDPPPLRRGGGFWVGDVTAEFFMRGFGMLSLCGLFAAPGRTQTLFTL